MVINPEVAVFGAGGSEPCGKIGTNVATESRVEGIHLMDFPRLGGNGDRIGSLPDLLQLSDNPHIRFSKLFLQILILGSITQEQRNVLGVRTQEESFLAASLDIAQHAHTTVDSFIAIADGAESDNL
jgi:hypothetical protein